MDVEQKKRRLLQAARHLKDLRGEALRLFRPLPHQVAIHSSGCKRLVIRGGNRSGKTVNGAVKAARRVEAPPQPGEKGRGLVVSLDNRLLAKNCYAKLFEPGAFRVCKECDQVQHACSCGPTEAEVFRLRSRPAPPLVPPRLVKRFVWLEKGRRILDFVELRNGWGIEFRSCESGREKFQGEDWDWAWIDEEGGSDESIMLEIERGLLENDGDLWWTATPLAAGVKLLEYAEAAREEEDEGVDQPYHEQVVLDTDDNPTIPVSARDKFFAGMSEDEERVRRRGDFLIQQGLVYREWDKKLHLVETHPVPESWTVYDLVDPGCANAFAILFLALKPNGDWVAFDEIYLRHVDIPDIVAEWRRLLAGGSAPLGGLPHWSQRTGIDPASKQIHAGMKLNHVKSQVEQERERKNLRSFEGDFGCFPAPNTRLGGILRVKTLLKVRTGYKGNEAWKNGTPQLTVMRHLVHFQREIRRYRWPKQKPDKDVNESQGPVKKDDHLMDLLRYGALMNLRYVAPAARPRWSRGDYNPGFDRLRKRKARRARDRRRNAMDCT